MGSRPNVGFLPHRTRNYHVSVQSEQQQRTRRHTWQHSSCCVPIAVVRLSSGLGESILVTLPCTLKLYRYAARHRFLCFVSIPRDSSGALNEKFPKSQYLAETPGIFVRKQAVQNLRLLNQQQRNNFQTEIQKIQKICTTRIGLQKRENQNSLSTVDYKKGSGFFHYLDCFAYFAASISFARMSARLAGSLSSSFNTLFAARSAPTFASALKRRQVSKERLISFALVTSTQ